MGLSFFRRAMSLRVLAVLGLLQVLAGTALAAPPANDNFANGQSISGDNAPNNAGSSNGKGVAGTTIDATLETGESVHGAYNSGSVWFRWTAPNSGIYEWNLRAPSGAYTVPSYLKLYTGNAVNRDDCGFKQQFSDRHGGHRISYRGR